MSRSSVTWIALLAVEKHLGFEGRDGGGDSRFLDFARNDKSKSE
jgi:hypothetical protein